MNTGIRWLVLALALLAAETAWSNVQPTAKQDDRDQVRVVAMHFLQDAASGKRDSVNGLLIAPSEGRLQEKLALMVTRTMELMAGGDLKEEALDPVRVEGDWGLVVTRQKRPKADRDKVKLSRLLLHKVDDGWKVVPKAVFSDPSLNVSRDRQAQALLRWYRAQQRAWTKKFVAPLMKEDALPDAMQHLATAPHFNIKRLRDPFASYLALVTQHSNKVLQARKIKLASRPKEPLEAFDLSTLKLVAIYGMHGRRVAMFEDNEGKGHTVEVGNHMGKYNGKITAIDDTAVHLLEEMINPLGEIEHKELLLTLASDKEKE